MSDGEIVQSNAVQGKHPGVGTAVKELIGYFGLQPVSGCSCEKAAAEWDAKGVEWCEQNKEVLINTLVSNAAKHPVLASTMKVIPLAVQRLTAKMLVSRAIRAVKKINSTTK